MTSVRLGLGLIVSAMRNAFASIIRFQENDVARIQEDGTTRRTEGN